MIIAVFTPKGGVGKTTTAINLAYLTSLKYKTLLIDLDTQGASSYFFNKKVKKRNLLNKNPSKIIKSTQYENLDIIPTDKKLEQYKKNLKSIIPKEYEIIFIDSPPTISKLTKDIVKIADLVISPLLLDILSLRSYNQLLDLNLNKNIKILLNQVEKTSNKNIVKTILKLPKIQYFKHYIPKDNSIEEMFIEKIPAVIKNKRIKKAYQNILDEII